MDQSQASEFELKIMQFKALRAEILEIKERITRLQIIGITGILVVLGAGQRYDLDTILIASPLITLVFSFMLVFEQNSLMRAGLYIKQNLEEQPFWSFKGWEHWLQEEPSRRTAERFFEWSAYIVFILYFALGTYLAYCSLEKLFSTNLAIAAMGVYGGGFILAFYVLVTNLPGNVK